MELAARNAAETLAREQARWLADQGKTLAALEELADALGLPAPPMRIECYDISTIQGTNTVGSMVVFEEGRPRSGEYRRFRIRTRSHGHRTTSPATGRCCGGASAARCEAEEGSRRGAALAAARPGRHRRRPRARSTRRAASSTSWACTTCRSIGLAKEREELFLPGASEPARAARQLAGALPGPAPARRGAPLRHHLPPQAARQGARRARCSTTCRASGRHASARCCASSARPSRCAPRRSTRSPSVPGISRGLAETDPRRDLRRARRSQHVR